VIAMKRLLPEPPAATMRAGSCPWKRFRTPGDIALPEVRLTLNKNTKHPADLRVREAFELERASDAVR
jgi:hypothetical protein